MSLLLKMTGRKNRLKTNTGRPELSQISCYIGLYTCPRPAKMTVLLNLGFKSIESKGGVVGGAKEKGGDERKTIFFCLKFNLG